LQLSVPRQLPPEDYAARATGAFANAMLIIDAPIS